MSFGEGVVNNKSRKGDYAEDIVHTIFRKKGYEVFSPTGKVAHLFDGLAVSNKDGKVRAIAFDVKSKCVRNLYPDTGCDLRHYNKYQEVSETLHIPFYLIFVDEGLGKVYFQKLNEYFGDSEKPYTLYESEENIIYPMINENFTISRTNEVKYIYFPLETMNIMKKLSEEEIKTLTDYSETTEKHYGFNPIWDQEKIKFRNEKH